MKTKTEMLSALGRLEHVARGNRFKRFLHRPIEYLGGIFHHKFLYPILKKPWATLAQTIMGIKMHLLLPAALDIYLTGGKTHDSEIRLTKWMITNLEPDDHVIDVGGHFGFYSLLSSALGCNVLGIEASPATYNIYLKNVRQHKKIKPLNLAAGAKREEITFYEFPTLYSEYNTTSPEQFKGTKWMEKFPPISITVKAMPLDDIAREHHVHPKFIKIDVEGAESKVISGMTNLLIQDRPIIALEYLVSERHNASHKLASDLICSYGYQSYCINEDGSLSVINDKEASILSRNLDSDNILFLPN